MISHELRCIFIHIPRCAGTSIEEWLCGRDWWNIDPPTKHMIASQAHMVYRPWWNHYFKFAVVRNPYSRVISLLKHDKHFGLRKEVGKAIDFSGYTALFGRVRVVEHDYQFVRLQDVIKSAHGSGCVYGNILDEPMDFIGRFENLTRDMAYVQRRLNLSKAFNVNLECSKGPKWELTREDRLWVEKTYSTDFKTFDYSRYLNTPAEISPSERNAAGDTSCEVEVGEGVGAISAPKDR